MYPYSSLRRVLLLIALMETIVKFKVVCEMSYQNSMYQSDSAAEPGDDSNTGIGWIRNGDPPPPAPEPVYESNNGGFNGPPNNQNQRLAQTFPDQVQGMNGPPNNHNQRMAQTFPDQVQGMPGGPGQHLPGPGSGPQNFQGQGPGFQQGPPQGFPGQQGPGFQQGPGQGSLPGQNQVGQGFSQVPGQPGQGPQQVPGQQGSQQAPRHQGPQQAPGQQGPQQHHHAHHQQGKGPHHHNAQPHPHEVVIADSIQQQQQRPSFEFNGGDKWDHEEREFQKQLALSKKMDAMGISKGNENYFPVGESGAPGYDSSHMRREELAAQNPQFGLQERPKEFYQGKIVHDPNTALILQQFEERKKAEMAEEMRRRQQQREMKFPPQPQGNVPAAVDLKQGQGKSHSHLLEDPPAEIKYKPRWMDEEDDENSGESFGTWAVARITILLYIFQILLT